MADLSSLESWARAFRHAIVLFGIGSSTAGLLAAWHKGNETKQRGYQVAGILLGFLVVGSAALNFDFSDRVAKAKDEEFQHFKLAKEIELKNLETGNLELRKQIGNLEKDNLKQVKQVAALQFEVATAKRRQAEAETQLTKVQKRQQPRTLGVNIIPILRTAPPGKIIIWYQQGLPESALFASSLGMTLMEGGWTVLEIKGLSSITEKGASLNDMDLRMWNLSDKSEPLRVLKQALTEAGYTVSGTHDPTLTDDVPRLIINPKL